MSTYIFVAVLILIVCLLLTLVVLVQNSKGGGLASNFAGSNQFLGVRRTTDFLEKSTWTLAIALLVLSLFSVAVIPRNVQNKTTKSTAAEALKAQQEAAKKQIDYRPAPGMENFNQPVQPDEQ
ncbi:MAG TPA: preprotein translocase subunit SecG [Bacteroidales bacterium]|nr:preprotein translocase subunit SecG [Bacteroidales bacterium]MDI9573334.1 preprotein translocase subunit SecG [Bacteroidota bacterium]OQC59859.1 MAG: preprotein translocase subunit SecG [Bacteroidetes bacterium ADurb.Bin012]MBP9511878.1 preprotein translocase subunit SecG [Bacteroidales bacterium]MBP9588325.1 preprotein translocase subunit SecG [Bacteroidales bacterium]